MQEFGSGLSVHRALVSVEASATMHAFARVTGETGLSAYPMRANLLAEECVVLNHDAFRDWYSVTREMTRSWLEEIMQKICRPGMLEAAFGASNEAW